MLDTRAANANGTKVVVPLGINMQRSGKTMALTKFQVLQKEKWISNSL